MTNEAGSVQAVSTNRHTPPIGKYSPAVKVSLGNGMDMVFVSGQVASDAEGVTICPGDASGQAKAVFANIAALVTAAGGNLGHIVSVVIYLTDMADFAAVSAVRNSLLKDPPPASTLVEVSRLAIADHLVEISAVAIVPGRAE
ncbi:RidA family protein [Micromonospora sp. NPDC051196]|uniref:RidA family protein n=1 Tax=Micromonospora sp. NPDC051196 TaxID=3155281 RepID=UPI003428510C